MKKLIKNNHFKDNKQKKITKTNSEAWRDIVNEYTPAPGAIKAFKRPPYNMKRGD